MSENRFKKSVNNAIDNTKANISYDMIDNTVESKKTNVRENITLNTTDDIVDSTSDNTLKNIGNDILKKVLEKNKKDKGGNHTIYLSYEVGEELNKLAKKTKKSKSTLVDEILRMVFFK